MLEFIYMSNSVIRSSGQGLLSPKEINQFKDDFIDLVASGYVESKILNDLNVSRANFIKICNEDPAFVKDIEDARKQRAEYWVSKIATNIDTICEAKDTSGERLRFDKLVFLAKADNPERYGTGKTKVDISLDLKQFKLLPPDEAVKALSSDPFAPVEVEFTEVSIDSNNTEPSINEEELL